MSNKVVLITGGTRGIGRACVYMYASKGYDIAFTFLNSEKKAKNIESDLVKKNVNILIKKVDNSKKEEIDHMVEDVIKKYGHIDVLVNNAAISDDKKIEEITEEDWDKMIDTNLKGSFFFSKNVFTHMKKHGGGRIINISSQAGITGGFRIGAHYSTSKGGILVLTRSFAKKGAEHNILVNTVSPGIIETDMIKSLPTNAQKDLAKKIPLNRIGKPEDVARIIYFLSTDESSYITGANIPVNGGMLMI